MIIGRIFSSDLGQKHLSVLCREAAPAVLSSQTRAGLQEAETSSILGLADRFIPNFGRYTVFIPPSNFSLSFMCCFPKILFPNPIKAKVESLLMGLARAGCVQNPFYLQNVNFYPKFTQLGSSFCCSSIPRNNTEKQILGGKRDLGMGEHGEFVGKRDFFFFKG